MGTKSALVPRALVFVIAGILFAATPYAQAAQSTKPIVKTALPAGRNLQHVEALREEVRHQLITLPYYSVFDWLEAQIKPDGTVVLKGEVTRPSLKDDAESRIKRLESATNVVNNIDVLPLSTMDDQLRIALYRSIYAFNSPLFRYATQSLPPIHIIVKNGNVTLKGIVASQADRDIANLEANRVSGVFSVRSELQVEGRTDERISKR